MVHVQNQDLELAKSRLVEQDLSLAIVKNGKVVFETTKHGIMGFLEAIEKLDRDLVASSVADKIVGVAASMLCAYSGVDSVFALTISEEAVWVLEDNKVAYLFEKKVANILNRDKTDVCPFEKLAMTSGNLEEAYVRLKSCASQMMKKSTKKRGV